MTDTTDSSTAPTTRSTPTAADAPLEPFGASLYVAGVGRVPVAEGTVIDRDFVEGAASRAAEARVEAAQTKARKAAAKLEKEEARLAAIRENPEMYTTGKLVRRKRPWHKKKHYRVYVEDDAGNEILDGEYASMAEIAAVRNLCYDTLRHVVANDRAGQEIKAERYRCFRVEKITT